MTAARSGNRSFINEYLDETFPDTPLVPKDALAKARMRYWVKFEDDVLHPVIRPASFNLMIRKAIAAMPKEHVEARLANHPNPSRAADFKAAAGKPADTKAVEEASVRIKQAIDRMDKWLYAEQVVRRRELFAGGCRGGAVHRPAGGAELRRLLG